MGGEDGGHVGQAIHPDKANKLILAVWSMGQVELLPSVHTAQKSDAMALDRTELDEQFVSTLPWVV